MFPILVKKIKNLYSSSPTIQRHTKTITSSPLYYQILKKFITYQAKKDLEGPFNLLIETTNICNAKCIMCPHRIMKRPQKVMSKKVFDQIVEKIKSESIPINKIYLNGFGEPFADPHFLARAQKLKKLNLFISFYTNASLLTPQISQRLVKLKIDELNISFNAMTKKSYHQIMGLNYDITIKNIDKLIKIRGQNPKPFIKISSVINQFNQADIKKHLDYWQNKADLVTVTQAHEWGGAVTNQSQHKFIKSNRTYPCRSLWHTFAIDVDGNFVLCCRDYESNYILGNITKNSFTDIKNSPLLKKIRHSHNTYQKSQLPSICQKCNFPYQDGIEWLLSKSTT